MRRGLTTGPEEQALARSRRALVGTALAVALAAGAVGAAALSATGFFDAADTVEVIGGPAPAGGADGNPAAPALGPVGDAAAQPGTAGAADGAAGAVPGVAGAPPTAAPGALSVSGWPVAAAPGPTGGGGDPAGPGPDTAPTGPPGAEPSTTAPAATPGAETTVPATEPTVVQPVTAPEATAPTAPADPCAPSGFDLTVCLSDGVLVTSGTGRISCSKATATEVKCGKSDTATEMKVKLSGGTVTVEHFPVSVGCVPLGHRVDCVLLGGQGEATARPASPFIELWAVSKKAVAASLVPSGCSPSKEFSCGGVAFETDGEDDYYALKVSYSLSAGVECGAYPDAERQVVVVRCGNR